ncbi:hypothetical protein N879_16920 [Alcaligenes sp. EGD-AK7]|nr:hypothetical protein N879_16920 [Alcaligenes sp. EGD-AK7]
MYEKAQCSLSYPGRLIQKLGYFGKMDALASPFL